MGRYPSGHLHALAVALGGTLFLPCSVVAQDDPYRFTLGTANTSFALGQETASEQTSVATRSSSASYPKWVTDMESKMWPGFLTGLEGYEDFVMPVGMFTYFEDPFITTEFSPAVRVPRHSRSIRPSRRAGPPGGCGDTRRPH